MLKEYDQLPTCQPGDSQLIAEGKIDLLGINYYQPRRVKCRDTAVNPNAPFMPEWLFDYYEMPGRKMNPYRGWEIYEPGIYDIITNLRDNYGNPLAALFLKTVWVWKMSSVSLSMTRSTTATALNLFLSILNGYIKASAKVVIVLATICGLLLITGPGSTDIKPLRFCPVRFRNAKRTVKKSGEWFAHTAENNGFN